MKICTVIVLMLGLVKCQPGYTQRYWPDAEDFVTINGDKRFNRALYGTNTGFRAEAGDLPEFALYMPGMGGNLRFGLISQDSSEWLINSDFIEARYRPGSMIYRIRNSFFREGLLQITVVTMNDAEGVILKLETRDVCGNCQLFWAFGGATGKRFPREGDIGADPESVFYLKPEYCKGNEFIIRDNMFRLLYDRGKELNGLVPLSSSIKISDAGQQDSPLEFLNSNESVTPAIAGILKLNPGKELYFIIWNPDTRDTLLYADAPYLFNEAETARKKLAGRIRIETPDPYINPIGGALSIAADAIWEEPTYLHGAVAWRMRLPGWRGAYAADWLGWHDRARIHFDAYLKSQYTSPDSGPSVPDPKTNFARQEEKTGNAVFTSGYISRYPGRISKPHHYDMNLVFFDQLLWHLKWTGDTGYARKIWPALKRHLAWEKRCFDGNRDGLYDAYASVWASDALQYSGGGVTHSSSYNFRANRLAAEVAEWIGENAETYLSETEKIHRAVNSMLWLPDKGWYAEFKDLTGLKLVHPSAAVWTVYHAIDAGIADAFQKYQLLRYTDEAIPHIPVIADIYREHQFHVLSTSSWMPYTWSINNVALAENLHTALAYWQGGRKEEAFRLWKSALLESMYLGSSPGNFQQLSGSDAFRGELYRDFADPVGMAARSLVEGLFGILPDAMHGTLTISIGIPDDWDYASLATPDIMLDYRRQDDTEFYTIRSSFPTEMNLRLRIGTKGDRVESVMVNNQVNNWKVTEEVTGNPGIEIITEYASEYFISVTWKGDLPEKLTGPYTLANNEELNIRTDHAVIEQIYDPQQILINTAKDAHRITTGFNSINGNHTFFIKLSQGVFNWWAPYNIQLKKPVEILTDFRQEANTLRFQIRNNNRVSISTRFTVNPGKYGFKGELQIPSTSATSVISVPYECIIPGSNLIRVQAEGMSYDHIIINWHVEKKPEQAYAIVDLTGYFNDEVANIFKNKYLSPRSPYPTLQLPVQGIGDWCSYNKTAEIDDSGFRKEAGQDNRIYLPQDIPFATPGEKNMPNIIFTSKWDNYPDKVAIALSGKASHVYLLMAGSTHHMQSRFINGNITISYTDGTNVILALKNPDNWWPIEQDYYIDDHAFRVDATMPLRVYLKTGKITSDSYHVLTNNKTIQIEGGAASVLDLPLDSSKELKELELETTANDVVLGLMGVTLVTE